MLVKSFKPSPAAVLASVVAEMAKPRVVESAKKAGDKLADGRDISINPSAKKRQFHLTGDEELIRVSSGSRAIFS